MSESPNDKKIIVDEDWKEEAQREKETLAKALEEEKRKKERPRVPDHASFAMLASSLATQALISMGEIENPITNQREVHLDEAKFHVDMLNAAGKDEGKSHRRRGQASRRLALRPTHAVRGQGQVSGVPCHRCLPLAWLTSQRCAKRLEIRLTADAESRAPC